MRQWVPGLLILFAAASFFCTGCNGGDPEDDSTGYFAGDYQISAYISNEVFQVSDLAMENGGIVVVVDRMKGTVRAADQAQAMLDGAPVPQQAFPLSTAEQAIYAIKGMAFKAGERHQIVVTIVGRSVSVEFVVPDVADIAFQWPKPAWYFDGEAIKFSWRYIPGSKVPSQVQIRVIDNYVGNIPTVNAQLAFQDTVPGTQTSYTISGAVTEIFDNDILLRIAIFDEYFWDFGGAISLFPQSRAYFINPYAETTVRKRCRDLDGDGYGNPSSNLCRVPSLVDDCKDNPLDDNLFLCWNIPYIWPKCTCDFNAAKACNLCSFCINPGVFEGPDPNAPLCLDAIDNNCNALIDCQTGREEPQCSCSATP